MKNLYNLLLALLLIFTSSLVYSSPAWPHPIKFTQPDGSVITVLLKGDEHVKWAETTDGYTILFNEKGFYVYGELNVDDELVRSEIIAKDFDKRSKIDIDFLKKTDKHLIYSSRQVSILKSMQDVYDDEMLKVFPTTGERKLICILMGYTDLAFTKTQSEFESLFNQINYNTDGATGSVKDYYLENSFGQFNLTVTVAGPYEADNDMAYYGANQGDSDKNPRALITEAVQKADDDVNYADFDNDGDGNIDGVYVIFAGFGEEAGADSDAIWSHAWAISTITLDGIAISRYSCSPELRGNSGTGLTRIGVICHEFGHVLGAPDYYDIDYSTGGQFTGTGAWDMMAGGSWNNYGATPAHHNAYTKTQVYNWASTTTLSSPGNITIPPVELISSGPSGFYIINTATAGEYFILENRQQIGFDAAIPGHGLVIYHKHKDGIDNQTSPQEFYPVCASSDDNPTTTSDSDSYGNINSAGCPFPGSSNQTSFTDVSTPWALSWAGAVTESPITNISEDNTAKTINFDFMGGVPCTLPTAQATSFTSSNLANNSMTVGWTRGTGGAVLVVARQGGAVNAIPVVGTSYTANAAFGTGDEIETGNFVVYNGTATSVDLTALLSGTDYYFSIFEYTSATSCYLSPALTGSASTTCTFPTTQATSFTSSSILDNSMTAGWTRGNGDNVLVVARAGGAVNTDPANGVSYTANAAFGSGSLIGTDNYVVYNGSGDFVNLTALMEGTTYHYAVYEYLSTSKCYLIPALTGDETTTGYCAAGSPATEYEYISKIVMGSISQTSGRGTAGYEDYTSQITSMEVGEDVSATITVTNDWETDQILIWVDWNQDGDFEDGGENVYSSSGTFSSPHTTSNFAPPAGAVSGETRMRIRLHDTDNGPNTDPCGNSDWGEVEDYTINVIPDCIPPDAATASVTVQPTCAITTGTIEVSAPLGDYEYNLDGGNYQSSVTFTGVAAGSHSILVRRSEDITCISTETTVTVDEQLSAPEDAVASVTVQPTCAEATATIKVSAPTGSEYEYNLDGGAYQTSVTFTGVAAGSHAILVRRTADNTCISTETEVTVNEQPSAPDAAVASVTQPTCAITTGTIEVTSPLGDYEYNIDGGTYQSSVTFSGVTSGSHTVLVRRIADNTCISTETEVTVDTQPSPPDAATVSVTEPDCSVATGTIVVTAPIGSEYEYNIDGGTYQTSVTFANLVADTYSILVRRTTDNSCVSSETEVTVNAHSGTPDAPTLGIITHPTCSVATGSVVLDGLPETGTWTLTRSPGGTITTGTGISKTITGLASGTYTYTVTDGVSGCISLASADVVINSQPLAPEAPTASVTVQPTCAVETGTIVVSSPIGAYEYNIDGGTYQTSTSFAGVAAGSHNILVRRTADPTCISSATIVTVDAQPSEPEAATASVTVQPSCSVSTGTVVVSAPTGSYEYNIDGGAYQTSVTFVGVVTGSHNILVRRATDYTCVSTETEVTVNVQPETPSAPAVGTITQPTCTLSTGSVVLNGLPSTGTWTINPGNITGTGSSKTISGLAAGSYSYTVTDGISGCTSGTSSVIVINVPASTPSAPVVGIRIQPTCTLATGSVVLNGLPSTGTWTINPGNIIGTGTSTTISGLNSGVYYYTVENASGCTSPSSYVIIYQQPETPTAPIIGVITQPENCSYTTGSVALAGLPSVGTWTLTQTPNGTTTAGTGTSAMITGLESGTYTFTVKNASGCTSIASANVVINEQSLPPDVPIIGAITQPTCQLSTGSVVLSGLPSTGIWTINPGGITGTGISTTITGLVEGVYSYTVTNESGCISDASDNVIIETAPLIPPVPIIESIVQPTCFESTGSVVIGGLPAGNWTINPGAISGSTTSITLFDLVAGTYNYTVTNEAGCISEVSADIVIDEQPITPQTPVITLNGTVLYSDAINGNQWYNQDGLINGATDQEYTITSNGDYYVIVTVLGCSSDASNIISMLNTGVDLDKSNKSINVYPNPVSNELIIEIEGNSEKVNFEIFNSMGQIVFKGNFIEKVKVETSSFTPGFYLIKLENGKFFEFKRIIKE